MLADYFIKFNFRLLLLIIELYFNLSIFTRYTKFRSSVNHRHLHFSNSHRVTNGVIQAGSSLPCATDYYTRSCYETKPVAITACRFV